MYAHSFSKPPCCLLKALIRPIMPFDAKNRDMNKLNERSARPCSRITGSRQNSGAFVIHFGRDDIPDESMQLHLDAFLEMNGRLGISEQEQQGRGSP